MARDRFNGAAQQYNTAIRTFPNVLYAGIFGFKERAYFQAAAGSDAAPKVQFDFNNNGTSGNSSTGGAPAPAK